MNQATLELETIALPADLVAMIPDPSMPFTSPIMAGQTDAEAEPAVAVDWAAVYYKAAELRWISELRPAAKIRRSKKLLHQMCSDQQLEFTRYYSALVAPDGAIAKCYTSDGLHPNRNGRVMTEVAQTMFEI